MIREIWFKNKLLRIQVVNKWLYVKRSGGQSFMNLILVNYMYIK